MSMLKPGCLCTETESASASFLSFTRQPMLLSEQLNSLTLEHLQVRQRGRRRVHPLFFASLRTQKINLS